MITLARLVAWTLVVAVAGFALVTGIAGMVFLPPVDAVMCFGLCVSACVLGAVALDFIAGVAPDVALDVRTDFYRVRNWYRRRYRLGVLAGGTTALSYQRTAAYR